MNKDKLEKNHNCDNVNCNHNNSEGLCCLYNPDNCKYRQLQKENAELKKQVEQKQHLADVRLKQSLENYKRFSDEQKKRIDIEIVLEDITDQLAKATELIEDMYDRIPASHSDYYKDVMERARQFLSEVAE